MIPGSNLLNLAHTVIKQQEFGYIQFLGTTTAANGDKVPSYAAPVIMRGSVQPIEQKVMKRGGLEWNQRAIGIWGSRDFTDVARDRPGDRVSFGNYVYDIIGEVEWFEVDGWDTIVAVRNVML